MKDPLISKETAELAKSLGIKHPILKLDLTAIDVTQTSLQTWLRKKYGIILICEYLDFEEDPNNYYYSIIGHPRELEEEDYYLTFEEALEKGLQGSLKIIRYERTKKNT